MNSSGAKDDIVISSRVRLARNVNNVPFPHKLEVNNARELVRKVEEAINSFSNSDKNFRAIHLWDNEPNDTNTYFEKHLISKNLLSNKSKSAFIINGDETVSVMVNEEDHLRIQCITAGMNLESAYDMAAKMDDLIEEKIDYAFDEKLGYLTTCPTNLGTGMRASVMIHLPALAMSNETSEVLNAVTQVGMTLRGLFGEGSKASGNIFQVSNQITLGVSEEDIMNNLNAVVKQIINQEMISRDKLMGNCKYELEDRIQRALGILKSAVLLDSNECLNLLSDVRLGVELGIIKDVNKELLNKLLVYAQPASLQKICNGKLGNREVQIQRAKLAREYLDN